MSASHFKKLPLLLEQSLFSGTGFIINITLAKFLSLEQYGVFASLIIVSHLVLSVNQALIIQPMQIQIGKTINTYSYRIIVLFFQFSLMCCFLLLFVGIHLAGVNILTTGQVSLSPFFLFLLLFLAFDFYRKFFLADGQLKMALATTVLYAAASFALLFYIILSRESTDLATLLNVLALGYVPALLVGTVAYLQEITLPGKEIIKKYLKVHFLDGQWLLYAAITQWLSGNLYVMASGLLIGVEALGVLRFVQSLFGVINILLQTIENYVLPQLSRAYQVSLQHCYQAFQNALGIYQLIILAGLVFLFLFAEQILRFAGSAEFVPYAYVLRGMVFLYAIIIVAYPIRLFIRVTELNKSYFIAYLISCVFSLASYQLLLSHFGVTGAIVGLIINQLILQATWLVVLKKNQLNVWKLYTS